PPARIVGWPPAGAIHASANLRSDRLSTNVYLTGVLTLAELFLPDSPGGFELRRIDVLVSRLRAKAQSAGLKLPVLSVRGQGYVFAA
ncbi:helix-turn-helix domain-containing protein, partial [Achromobacter marplatensis]